MKKTLLRLSVLSVLCMLFGGVSMAKTAIISSTYMVGQPTGTHSSTTANNVWFGDGKNLNAGFMVEISSNRGKSLSKQSKITINGTEYDAFKNSNGAQNTITLPTGYTAYSVDFYVTANGSGDALLSEVAGVACEDAVTSHQNGAKPTIISKILATPASSFTFTFKTTQVFFVAVVHYLEATDKPEFVTNLPEEISVRQGVATTLTAVAIGANSYQWYKASSTTANPATDSAIEGATSSSFEYTSTTAETEYIYCAATNTNGTETSSVCTLTKRSFTDFKIEFRNNPYTVLLPTTGELPAGVTVNPGTYNGGQHGVQAPVITVPVDGPVKFTIGACQYSTTDITISDTNGGSTTFSNKAPCGEQAPNYNQYVVYTYNVEKATTLTFTFGSSSYLPYFFAEACDFIPSCEITYYDVDGSKVLATETVTGNTPLVFNAEATAAVTVAEGKKFRGWFDDKTLDALKVAEGTVITQDIKLYAKATEIETVEVGKMFKYDLTKNYFYEEDHEAFINNGGSFHDGQHGWSWGNGKSFSIPVAGNAQIVLGLCAYSSENPIVITAENSTEVEDIPSAKAASDGATTTINYSGEATTLTFTFGGTTYIHDVKVFNVESLPTKDAESGYYIIGAGDGAGLMLALNSASAEDGAKIFLPNGTYDWGEAVQTTISGSNVSIIGQSAEGVIIKTAPDKSLEGLNSAALLANTGSNFYMQDLTLKNELDYYGAGSAGRANAFWDKGSKTICKNVRLLSYQDTYLSATDKQFYFEGGEIHGTVDYICGGSDVYFQGVKLVNEVRAFDKDGNPTSECTITAHQPKTAEKFGYVFNECTVETLGSSYNFGRAWGGASGATARPMATYLNTTLTQPDKLNSTRFILTGMNNQAGVFHEYNSKDANGDVVSPASLEETFTDKTGTDKLTYNIILSATEAENYSVEKVFTDWQPATIAAQLEAPAATYANGNVTWTPANNGATAYLIEKNGAFAGITAGSSFAITIDAEKDNLTIRAANGRGGFGEAKQVEGTASGIHAVKAAIERGEKVIFNLAGQRVDAAYKGLVIRDGVKIMQK